MALATLVCGQMDAAIETAELVLDLSEHLLEFSWVTFIAIITKVE